MRLNLNDFAVEITKQEAGAVSLPIGQVKEVMKLVFEKLAKEDDETILDTIHRYK